MSTRYPDTAEVPVTIPTLDGKSVAETITITVPCRIDTKTGDAILGGEALRLIDKTKARHMGLLLPEELRLLRDRLRLNQAEMAEVLQIGAKSYSRWENGRERPSRSINILLRALWDGKVDVSYLRSIRSTKFNWWPKLYEWHQGRTPRPYTLTTESDEERCNARQQTAA